jgi:hypothetical protein
MVLANGSPTQQFSEHCGSAVCGLTVRGLIGYTARMSMTYPSSPSDARWDCIHRLLPPRSPHGRLRRHSLRSVFDAHFYLLRTDRPWRYLPNHFPPWQSVAIISSNFAARASGSGSTGNYETPNAHGLVETAPERGDLGCAQCTPVKRSSRWR